MTFDLSEWEKEEKNAEKYMVSVDQHEMRKC